MTPITRTATLLASIFLAAITLLAGCVSSAERKAKMSSTLLNVEVDYREAQLRTAATEEGWIFVDNLASLRAYGGPNRLYNGNDYHISRTASQIIGEKEARAFMQARQDSAAATR